MNTENNIFKDLFDMFWSFPQFPYLNGKPKSGVWYRVPLENCVCGNGVPYYASMKIGTSRGLIINFHGGGAAWNDFMAAHPMSPENFTGNGFYWDCIEPVSDGAATLGILSEKEDNYFHDWSAICINYSSADFHVGTSQVKYKALDGTEKILYHHGYINFKKAIETICPYLPEVDTLLICGESAGGFATYALAGDIIKMFPQCSNITICADGCHICYNEWKNIAVSRWKAPKHITDKLTERNYTLGCMLGLYKEYGDRVKFLYTSSTRDGALGDFQEYIDFGKRGFTKHGGDLSEANLREMVDVLNTKIKNCGLYIYGDIPYEGFSDKDITLHTILLTDYTVKYRLNGLSPQEWLKNAVNGNVEKQIQDGWLDKNGDD